MKDKIQSARFEGKAFRRLAGNAVLLLLAIPLLGQQQQAPREPNSYSFEKEAALGSGLADEYRRRVPSVDDSDLLAYVSRIAARLNEFAQEPSPFTIEISGDTDPRLETVGLPGGHLFVPLRLLASAPNEGALANSIAHSIAHIGTTRQVAREGTRGQRVNPAAGQFTFMGGWEYSHAAAPAMVPIGFRKIQAELETEAVRLSAEWMTQSGLADGSFQTAEFEKVRERARALVRATRK